jgi:uncharacterized membrane protein YoaT (DUF817 family)
MFKHPYSVALSLEVGCKIWSIRVDTYMYPSSMMCKMLSSPDLSLGRFPDVYHPTRVSHIIYIVIVTHPHPHPHPITSSPQT